MAHNVIVRVLLAALVVTTVVPAASAGSPEGKRRKESQPRVVSVEYETGIASGIEDVFLACMNEPTTQSCLHIPTDFDERFVTVEIQDATGLPVPAYLRSHPTDDTDAGSGIYICGGMERFRLVPGLEVDITLNAAHPTTPCAGLATTGVVHLEFFKR